MGRFMLWKRSVWIKAHRLRLNENSLSKHYLCSVFLLFFFWNFCYFFEIRVVFWCGASASRSHPPVWILRCYFSKFNHPNVVRLHWIQWDPPRLRIILEFMGGGDLRSFLREARPTQVGRFFCNALMYLMDFIFRITSIRMICEFQISSI